MLDKKKIQAALRRYHQKKFYEEITMKYKEELLAPAERELMLTERELERRNAEQRAAMLTDSLRNKRTRPQPVNLPPIPVIHHGKKRLTKPTKPMPQVSRKPYEKDYQKLKEAVIQSRECNLEVLAIEVKNMHKGRHSRVLIREELTVDKLIEATLQNQAYRSRMVEISAEVSNWINHLNTLYEVTRSILLSRDDIPGKTKVERESFVDSLIKQAFIRISEFQSFKQTLDMYIADLDQSHWSLKTIYEIILLKTQREYVL